MNVSVVIPNYNGEKIIEKCLSSLAGFEEIIVVDDGSKDNSVQLIKARFSNVRLIEKNINKGFSDSVNTGIKAATGEFILLLNTDVVVESGLIPATAPLFDNKDVFSVSPKIILPRYNGIDEGCKYGKWHNGMFFTDQKAGIETVSPTLYSTGCAAIYRKSMLDILGGFDEIYSPFYWEDADLGYRAWKRGWKSLYQPAAAVQHEHSASTSKISFNFRDKIKARNSLLFIWRNITDGKILKKHNVCLPAVAFKRLLSLDTSFIAGVHEALKLKAECLQFNNKEEYYRKLSDRDIFNICGIDIK